MKYGFTGTQHGMTEAQQRTLRALITDATEFHHGDCIGADEQAHVIARSLGIPIHVHPPINNSKRAFCEGAAHTYPEKEYLSRNRDIVDATGILIATPKGFEEEQRSGTWSTIRYAEKFSRSVVVIWPDGVSEVLG